MTRYLLGFLTLFAGFQLRLQAQKFNFTRTDTVPALHGTDTLDYAWAGGLSYSQFSKIDLDLDGIKDLFVFDRTGNQILTFINKGGAGINYEYIPAFESLFPSGINSWCLLEDYNCDGKEDIFTYTPGGIKIYRNISDTSLKFQLATNLLKSNQLGNYINLYVSSVDLPAIYDIDYDGDKDILTYGLFGKYIEYHKNMSIENGFSCDSLPFIMKNECWGCFSEDISMCSLTLFDTCAPSPFIPGGPEMAPPPGDYKSLFTANRENQNSGLRGAERHTGSAIMALDMNNQNSVDLLVSDISCNNLTLLINGGVAPNLNTCMISKDTAFPSNSIPVNIPVFPAAFHLDLDNDGVRDLAVSPNSTVQSNNYNGNWYYKNVGTELAPIFNYIGDAFLQNQMFERGEGSVPSFFDYNNDGLKDLVIANFGFYDVSGSYISRLALYENVGTAVSPSFKLINNDYELLYSQLGKSSLLPTFGDLDNDTDADMIVGDDDGNIHYFKNIAPIGNPADFSSFQLLMQDDLATVIDVGQNAAPHLVDIDRDGDQDLIIGEKNANLNYYQNIGTTSNPIFKLITSNFGDVHVNEYWTPFGYSIPYVLDKNGEYSLFVGSLKGMVYHYDSIDNNLAGNFTLIDSLPVQQDYFGIRSAPAVADLNTNGFPEMVVGNFRGGLTLFSSNDFESFIPEQFISEEINISLFPNPTNESLNILTNHLGKKYISIYNSEGQLIEKTAFNNKSLALNVSHYSSGLYLIKIAEGNSQGFSGTARFLKL